MRYAVLTLTLALLLFATPLHASWFPVWSQTDVQLYVGERAYLRVTPTWSGLVDMGGVHWTFTSDNPAVVTGSAQLDYAEAKTFDIVGISPGIAHIRNAGGFAYVTIRVACGSEDPAVAAVPVVPVELGREVHLAVVSEYENRSTFRWYLGEIGDMSHPLGSSSPDATFTADSIGTRNIWAEVATVCSTSHVQFRVEVYGRQRQRPARH